MRSYDLSPLYRSTVGFDRLFALMDQAPNVDTAAGGYPPYNIEKTAENGYRISIAVAGFAADDLTIEAREQALVVKGQRTDREDVTKRDYLFQGIAARSFERRFQLADFVSVTGASLENGLLHIDLVRVVPEEKKVRQIQIVASGARTKAIDGTVLDSQTANIAAA